MQFIMAKMNFKCKTCGKSFSHAHAQFDFDEFSKDQLFTVSSQIARIQTAQIHSNANLISSSFWSHNIFGTNMYAI